MTGAARRFPWGAIGRALLLVAGAAVVGWLVHRAGPAKVAAILRDAWTLLPVLYACEMTMVTCDVLCVRWQLGAARAKVPLRSWIWSSTFAYALQILFPAGRAAGEVARASVLGRHVGFARAAVASVGYQASNLYAVSALSAIAAIVSFSFARGVAGSLPKFEALNFVVVAGLATFVASVLRSKRAADFVAKKFRLSVAHQGELDEAVATALDVPRGAMFCTAGRFVQWLQYGVCLAAIGGKSGPIEASIAHGVQLVGATLGDVIPNQLGAVEGAYTAFADVLRLGPERVLALPLLIRVTQLSLAVTCLAVATAMGRRAPPAPAADAESPSRGG